MANTWGVVITVWVICAIIGAAIGHSKGNGTAGFFLGLLLGPLGILIAAVMKPTPEAEAEHRRQVNAAMGTAGAAGWWPDPHGRHKQRYYDGARWTEHVVDDGVQSTDAAG